MPVACVIRYGCCTSVPTPCCVNSGRKKRRWNRSTPPSCAPWTQTRSSWTFSKLGKLRLTRCGALLGRKATSAACGMPSIIIQEPSWRMSLAVGKDKVFLQLKALLEPFGITRYFTDGWGAYERHVEAEQHTVGKAHTQKIERKHLTLRTRIKRLVRKTICFSKSIQMHDIVIGLFVNRYAFGLLI